MTSRTRAGSARVGAAVAVVGGLALAGLAAVLVPWGASPGGGEPLPAADTYFTAEHLARAEAFARWSRVWSWGALAVSLAVVAALGFTSAGHRLVGRLPGPWPVRVVLAVLVVLLAARLATLPLAAARHELRLRSGLSTQAWGGWAGDVASSALVTTTTSAVAVLVVVWLARLLPRAWPAVAGAALAGLVVLGSYVYPLLVEPLFLDFASLPDGELRSEVVALAEREGVVLDDVLVADASRRTTTLNAYVSGFGDTRRVVLYDTLVQDAPRGEALAVVAHELVHAARRDVLVGTALGATGALGAVGLAAVLLRRRDVGDPRVVPTVLALVAIASLAAAPAENLVSRRLEARADAEALRATGDPASFVALQVRLARRSLADPTPPRLAQIWFGSHPTTLERIASAGGSRQERRTAGPRRGPAGWWAVSRS